MNELDAYRYWQSQNVTGNALIKKVIGVLANYTKGNKIRKREILALSVSLIKAKCYEDGIKWSEMALSEHRFIKSIEELPAIIRKPPPPPKDPKKEPKKEEKKEKSPDPKQLEREFKKAELAKKVAELQEQLNDISESE